MNVTAVREEIADLLTSITGLRGHARVPDQINPPAAFVGSPAGTYHLDFDEGAQLDLPVIVVVSPAPGADRSQQLLDPYLDVIGTQSIKATLEAASGVEWDSLSVLGWEDYGATYTFGGDTQYVGAQINVQVWG